MKINAIQANSLQPINTGNKKKNPAFTAYYTPQGVEQLEKFIMDMARQKGSHLTDIDIAVMRRSIASFNAFYNGTKTLNPQRISNDLYHKFNIPSDFRGDRILAGASALVANIFHKLKLTQPKGIYKDTLGPNIMGDCNLGTRIIRFTDQFYWPEVQQEAIKSRVSNHSSSGHFLKTFIHEFMHNYHIKRLDDILDQSQANPTYASITCSPTFRALRQQPNFVTRIFVQNGTEIRNERVKDYIANKLSQYGSTMPAEMFAESGAKLIANSLDMKTLRPLYNPFTFKNFTQDKFLMQMMDDFYNGKFDKYL
ncbi:MAG: hypothetical protein NC191_08565 [Muribaculaceae bacterium]|nr:hypothetical protein [Muribaculaceae bacterium]